MRFYRPGSCKYPVGNRWERFCQGLSQSRIPSVTSANLHFPPSSLPHFPFFSLYTSCLFSFLCSTCFHSLFFPLFYCILFYFISFHFWNARTTKEGSIMCWAKFRKEGDFWPSEAWEKYSGRAFDVGLEVWIDVEKTERWRPCILGYSVRLLLGSVGVLEDFLKIMSYMYSGELIMIMAFVIKIIGREDGGWVGTHFRGFESQ